MSNSRFNQKDGRGYKAIHPEFERLLRETGRIASTEPALQNIPLRTEEGRKIREAFLPRKGSSYVYPDFSALEMRLYEALAKEDDQGSEEPADND